MNETNNAIDHNKTRIFGYIKFKRCRKIGVYWIMLNDMEYILVKLSFTAHFYAARVDT